jgi:Tetrapyrrole (Corrin/Porphyrin) Methylases
MVKGEWSRVNNKLHYSSLTIHHLPRTAISANARPTLSKPIMTKTYPTYEKHQKAWEELAAGIAAIRNDVREIEEGEISPRSKPGSLTIIGTGIETIGIAVGDVKLIEDADRVLFCVADPATIVWLKRLRPDALDLYVLYEEGKIRYTTYMQMSEAQLYWVRKGLNVVVVFYGHPGIFVLSTHRAIKLARREGHKAIMKAGVCALDTLCADLGVDPCHPGLQTGEATDCLIRQRKLDPTLHVVLWQVGLIGELGYRRQGYLNTNFSYFISWLQRTYGNDYPVTHYIGSRYPTIDSLIEIYKLSELHNPEIQTRITGLSTFYIPPRDVVPTHFGTAKDLGIITDGQHIVPPRSPLREIGQYGPKEKKAFDAFAKFRIPPSYKWQEETAASDFLIALRFDTTLQQLYEKDPLKALEDPRFKALSDRERAMLVSRDSGAIQIASKGAYKRSIETENTLMAILNEKGASVNLLRKMAKLPRGEARQQFLSWLQTNEHRVDWPSMNQSIDYVNQNNLFPWTGVYIEEERELAVTLIGNGMDRKRSVLYINDQRIKHFSFEGGAIRWKGAIEDEYSGFLRLDADVKGRRRIIGKVWRHDDGIPVANNFIASEADPERKSLIEISIRLLNSDAIEDIYGNYAVRTNGRFAKDINHFEIKPSGLVINDTRVTEFKYKRGKLSWKGGTKECYAGDVTLIIDPIIKSIELFGQSFSKQGELVKCYGSSIFQQPPKYNGPKVPGWAEGHLAAIAHDNSKRGGLLLWHKWEKHHFTSRLVNKTISALA